MRFSTLLALALLAALYIWAQQVNAPVRHAPGGSAQVVDGDSMRVGGEMIRLKGIDAPEYNQTCTKAGANYPCGRESAAALRRLTQRGTIKCAGLEHDRFGRLLATCHVDDVDIAGWLVREGLAVSYGDYVLEEAQARAAGKGLWAGDFMMPRDWRTVHPRELPTIAHDGHTPSDAPVPPPRPTSR